MTQEPKRASSVEPPVQEASTTVPARARRSTLGELFGLIAKQHSIQNTMRLDDDERVIIIDRKRTNKNNNQLRSAMKPLTNMFETDGQTITVIFDGQITAQAQVSIAEVLASNISSKLNQDNSGNHKPAKITMFYHGSLNSDFHEFLLSKFSHLPHRNAAKYKFKFEGEVSGERANNRTPVLKYLAKSKPKFVIVGMQRGMSSSVLGSEKDVSLRECNGATPIVVKVHNERKKDNENVDDNLYGASNWAFQVDWTDDAFHAFTFMLPYIRDGDHVHLIWAKPDSQASNFGNTRESLHACFHPFQAEIAKANINAEVSLHIVSKPNVGQVLTEFANKKQNAIDFLVVYCDLMKESGIGKELIGSVSDHCVRYSNCPVIVPKYHPKS